MKQHKNQKLKKVVNVWFIYLFFQKMSHLFACRGVTKFLLKLSLVGSSGLVWFQLLAFSPFLVIIQLEATINILNFFIFLCCILASHMSLEYEITCTLCVYIDPGIDRVVTVHKFKVHMKQIKLGRRCKIERCGCKGKQL